MRALVTGVGGFAGRHLVRHLLQAGDLVSGLGRHAECDGLEDGLTLFPADLRDRGAVDAALAEFRPEVVFHLAAQSSAGDSLHDPWGTLGNNLQAQLTLLEALVASGLQPRTLVVGSGDEYGRVRPHEVPTSEDVPLRPTTPYGVSKAAQDLMGHQYFAQHGLPVVRVRPFNHTGPGHDERFVVPSFARQLALVEAGLCEPVVRVGNLDVYRDFTDVRDMVRAYRVAVLVGEPGEVYNLGRGSAIRVGAILEDLVRLCRVPVRVVPDPQLFRPADVPRQQAAVHRFHALSGWEPEIPWENTLRDTLEYWRQRVAAAPAVATPGTREPPGA